MEVILLCIIYIQNVSFTNPDKFTTLNNFTVMGIQISELYCSCINIGSY